MIDYYEYIKSEQWYKRTEPIRKRNGGLCECCLMRYGSSVHHRSYEHLGAELDEELLHSCSPCHRAIHGKTKMNEHYFIWPSRINFLQQLRKEVQLLGLFDESK